MSDDSSDKPFDKARKFAADTWENDTARRTIKGVLTTGATVATGPVGLAASAGASVYSEVRRSKGDTTDGDESNSPPTE